jgi:hypothetical protein
MACPMLRYIERGRRFPASRSPGTWCRGPHRAIVPPSRPSPGRRGRRTHVPRCRRRTAWPGFDRCSLGRSVRLPAATGSGPGRRRCSPTAPRRSLRRPHDGGDAPCAGGSTTPPAVVWTRTSSGAVEHHPAPPTSLGAQGVGRRHALVRARAGTDGYAVHLGCRDRGRSEPDRRPRSAGCAALDRAAGSRSGNGASCRRCRSWTGLAGPSVPRGTGGSSREPGWNVCGPVGDRV